jgi:hypothetical protein
MCRVKSGLINSLTKKKQKFYVPKRYNKIWGLETRDFVRNYSVTKAFALLEPSNLVVSSSSLYSHCLNTKMTVFEYCHLHHQYSMLALFDNKIDMAVTMFVQTVLSLWRYCIAFKNIIFKLIYIEKIKTPKIVNNSNLFPYWTLLYTCMTGQICF